MKLENELKDLKCDLKAKDEQLIKLSIKEGELNGKDQVIATLNSNIEKMQHQLDSRRDCHIHDNPLQRVVDELIAKNIELEDKLKVLQEKSVQELQGTEEQ